MKQKILLHTLKREKLDKLNEESLLHSSLSKEYVSFNRLTARFLRNQLTGQPKPIIIKSLY
jgi:hypothetical protein